MSSFYKRDGNPRPGDRACTVLSWVTLVAKLVTDEEYTGPDFWIVEDDQGEYHMMCENEMVDIGYYGD